MRSYFAAVFVLALGCGAGTSATGAIPQRAVFAATVEGDSESHPRHRAVSALPVITVLRGGATTIVVRGHATKRRARQIARMAAQTYSDFNRRFGVTPKDANGRRSVDICVFDGQRPYRQAAHEVFGRDAFFDVGFYMPSHRLVMVDTAKGLGNLRHEMIHPLVKDWWRDIPAWVDEGLASLYGSARYRRGRFRFLNNYRLRHFRRAAATRTLPGLTTLSQSTYDDVHGPHERAYYAVARYLLLNLERRKLLTRFIAEMRGGDLDAARQLSILQRYINYRRFVRWAVRLR